jgi:copper resistance protein D
VTPLYELAAATWPPLVAVALLFGTSAFAMLAMRTGAGDERAFTIPWRVLALALALFSPLELLAAAANVGGTTMRGALPLLGLVLRDAHVGRLWLWRIPLTIALVAAAFVPLRAVARASSILCLSAAILVLFALGSHAIDHGAFAVLIYTTHELAAAAWLGTLAGFVLIATATATRERVAELAPRVSRIALLAVTVLALTGLYNAWLELGVQFHLLVDSLYGRMLFRKLVFFSLVLCVAAYNRWRLVPAAAGSDASARRILVRSVAIEIVLLFVVLGWTVLLANSPPPH